MKCLFLQNIFEYYVFIQNKQIYYKTIIKLRNIMRKSKTTKNSLQATFPLLLSSTLLIVLSHLGQPHLHKTTQWPTSDFRNQS